ncbi:TnpV protein [Dorea formicigenerans]
MYLNNGRPIESKSWTEKLGVNQCFIRIQNHIMDTTGVKLPEEIINQFLCKCEIDVSSKYQNMVKEIAEQYVRELFDKLRDYEYNEDLMKLYVMGGGAKSRAKGELDMLEEMTYKEVDGLLYPQIEMPDETEDLTKLGKYGRMAMNYLKENEPARYKTLMRFGKMYEKMSAVEEEANQLYDQLEMQYLAKHKPQNPSSTMEMWKIREQAKMQAEEVVLNQIVMRFH